MATTKVSGAGPLRLLKQTARVARSATEWKWWSASRDRRSGRASPCSRPSRIQSSTPGRRLRGAMGSDPRCLRRGQGPMRARGPPLGDCLRPLDAHPRARGSWGTRGVRFNWDPSHLTWQRIDSGMFLWEFQNRIFHVDCKHTRVELNGRNGVLGSHLTWAIRGAVSTSCRSGTAPVRCAPNTSSKRFCPRREVEAAREREGCPA